MKVMPRDLASRRFEIAVGRSKANGWRVNLIRRNGILTLFVSDLLWSKTLPLSRSIDAATAMAADALESLLNDEPRSGLVDGRTDKQ